MTTASPAYDAKKLKELLEKADHYDKDERFMATSDLMQEINKIEGALDVPDQKLVRNAIMKQLEDSSNDVQAVAVKCLSTIVKKFQEDVVKSIVDKLGQLMAEDKDELRDIFTIGLKTIIASVPDSFGGSVVTVAPSLIEGCRFLKHGNLPQATMCLDVLKDLLQRFGKLLVYKHMEISDTLSPMLKHDKSAIRKRASVTLGALVNSMNDTDFDKLIDGVLKEASRLQTADDILFTYIQTIGVFSREAGVRVGKHLGAIVPKLLQFCDPDNQSISVSSPGSGRQSSSGGERASSDDDRNELIENCLQAFESLIFRCAIEITPHVTDIVSLCLKYITYDPNYNYDEPGTPTAGGGDDDDAGWGDDDDGGDGGDGWGDDEDDGGQQYVDDDDTSWKVRRASIKCLSAFVRAKNEMLRDYYKIICEALVTQFKDRDINVKMEVFAAFRDLLAGSVVARGLDGREELLANREHDNAGASVPSSMAPPMLLRQRSSFEVLEENVPLIVSEIQKQFRSGKLQTKQGVLTLLRELIIVRAGNLEPYLPELLPFTIEAVKDKDNQLRERGLELIGLFIRYHRAEIVRPYAADIVPVVNAAISDGYTAIKSSALRVIGALAAVLRPESSTPVEPEADALTRSMYSVALTQLKLADIEQEVKEAAIDSVSRIVARFGDILSAEARETLPLLMERLGNEVTRQAALRGLATLAVSPSQVDLSSVASEAVAECVTFLRKQSQALRHETVQTLDSLLQSTATVLKAREVESLMGELASHISDADLFLSHLVFRLVRTVVSQLPAMAAKLPSDILEQIYALVKSPLLHGVALDSLKLLFQEFVGKSSRLSHDRLMDDLLSCVAGDASKQSITAASQCIAALVVKVDLGAQDKAIKRFESDTRSSEVGLQQVALLSIGEIGRERDLTSHQALDKVILDAFDSEHESVKWAASFALGHVAVGNLGVYLPRLEQLIEAQPLRRYLLFNSLREILNVHAKLAVQEARARLSAHSDQLVTLLLEHSSSSDEGVRTMVSECLGRICSIHNETVLPLMEARLTSDSEYTRASMVAALKFAVVGNARFLQYLHTHYDTDLAKFLALLRDPNLDVQRKAFLTFDALVREDLTLVKAHLGELLPVIFQKTEVNTALIREVDLGPFREKVDDGLPLRKAAFMVMDTLGEKALQWLDFNAYVSHLVNGLTDVDDVQLLTYQVLYRLAKWHGPKLLEIVDTLPPALLKGIKSKIKEAKAADGQRAKEILRAAVKALYSITLIPGCENMNKFNTFYTRVLKTALLVNMLADVQEELDRA